MGTVVVVGGGISGLACAWSIKRRAPETDLTLLEASDRAGGVVGSRRKNGYVFDLGPSGWLHRGPTTAAMSEALGLGPRFAFGDEGNRGRYVLSGGRLRRFPDGLSSFLRTDLLSVRGKSRLLLEPLVPHRTGAVDESAFAFAERRLGTEAAAFLVDPIVAGIFAGDPQNLSLQATLPSMARVDAAGRSLLISALRARRAKRAQDAGGGGLAPGAYVSYEGGMGDLVEGLVGDLGERVRLGESVRRVRRSGGRWNLEMDTGCREADAVVLALPGPRAAEVLGDGHKGLAEGYEGIPYVPIAVVGLGFGEEQIGHPLDGYGYLLPSQEAGDVLGVLWSTSIFPGRRAPAGKVMMRVMLGGARLAPGAPVDREAFVERAVARVSRDLHIKGAPEFVDAVIHKTGLPQYRVRHLERVKRLRAAAGECPGLHLLGNALDGVGMNALTGAADAVAAQVVEDVAASQGS